MFKSFKKTISLLSAICIFGVSLTYADHNIQKEDRYDSFFLENPRLFLHNDQDFDENYAGFSKLYSFPDDRALHYRKSPIFHRYHPGQMEWDIIADINVNRDANLFQTLIAENHALKNLMSRASNVSFWDHPEREFIVKIVVQELSEYDPNDAANPLTFRPQYFTAPQAKGAALNAEDVIAQNMRVAFLPIDGLPLSIIAQFPRNQPNLPVLERVQRQPGEVFPTNVSIHPQNAREGQLNNVLSGPVPAVAPEFLQRNPNGTLKMRAIWSVLHITNTGRAEGVLYNNVATLHIFVPPEQAETIHEISLNPDITTFEEWLRETGLENVIRNASLVPNFDAREYLRKYQDLANAARHLEEADKIDWAKWHYETYGIREKRSAPLTLPGDFNSDVYIQKYKDIERASEGMEENTKRGWAEWHYLIHGRKEGRTHR